jgi:uroporphyrinogen-III synthase
MKRVVLTTARESLAGLADALRALHLQVFEQPLISFLPPDDWSAFDQSVREIDSFAAVALTSPRAAAALAARLPKTQCAVPTWTSGTTTAQALGDAMTAVHVADSRGADEGAAEAVADAMLDAGVGSPVLFPCGNLRRDALVVRLEAAGVTVRPALCYRTVLGSPEKARNACDAGDVVVVGSPSVARLLAANVDQSNRPRLVALGRTTAMEAERSGWRPDAVADRADVDGVVRAIAIL